MLIIKPRIFENYPEVNFGFSTKLGRYGIKPYYFNMSFSVGDDENNVKENRELFFNALELSSDSVAFQTQVHGDNITIVDKSGNCGDSDAMITVKTGLGLVISTADCAAIFLFDKENKIIAGVHSGWRGTQKRILDKTLKKLFDDFNSQPENIIAYIAPSICPKNYEVGKEVAELFDEKYLKSIGEKFLLDVAGVNLDILLENGLKPENIEKSNLCTYELKRILHSYRRDGPHSGRALAVISLKNK